MLMSNDSFWEYLNGQNYCQVKLLMNYFDVTCISVYIKRNDRIEPNVIKLIALNIENINARNRQGRICYITNIIFKLKI